MLLVIVAVVHSLSIGRRAAVASLSVAVAPTTIVTGVATLDAAAPTGDDAALYVTVKKGAGAQAVAGLVKAAPSPPVAALRVPLRDISFPYTFRVVSTDVFPGVADLTGVSLTVSARLDQDGVAATRGAEDLVATGFAVGADPTPVQLTLKGRGIVSSFMTKK